MIKKFLVKLVGEWNKRSPSHFDEREAIERDNAEYNKQLAKQRMAEEREREKEKEWIEVPLPTEAKITGPSESKTEEPHE